MQVRGLVRLSEALRTGVWGTPLARYTGWRRRALHAARIAHMALRELVSGDLSLRAASLVFTTILALVPLLAVSFSLLKGFGVHNRMEVVLFNLLSPLGADGQNFATRIVQVVDRIEVGVLGGLGLLILILTVVSLVQKVEAALNHTWRVAKSRGFVRRFSGYLSVLLVGPVLVMAALAMEIVQKLAAAGPFAQATAHLPALLPYGLVLAAFVFAYGFMPNTRVRLVSALVGGVVGVVLWVAAGWGFAAFVVNPSQGGYAAIYSSFAVVFFFILWLYVAWLILLLGGTVAFYHQHPEFLGVLPGELKASNQLRERIALAALVRVGRAHLEGEPPPTASDLAQAMGLPGSLLNDTLEALTHAGFLAQSAGAVPGLLPGRDVGRIRLVDILMVSRSAHEHRSLVPEHLPSEPEAESLMDELESGAASVLGARTLEDLIESTKSVQIGERVTLRKSAASVGRARMPSDVSTN